MPNEEFFSYIMVRTMYIQLNDDVRFVWDQHANYIFIVLVHWNNNPREDMSPLSDTLSRLGAKQS